MFDICVPPYHQQIPECQTRLRVKGLFNNKQQIMLTVRASVNVKSCIRFLFFFVFCTFVFYQAIVLHAPSSLFIIVLNKFNNSCLFLPQERPLWTGPDEEQERSNEKPVGTLYSFGRSFNLFCFQFYFVASSKFYYSIGFLTQ